MLQRPTMRDHYTRQLTFLFGLVYFAQGIGQDSGLLGQPLKFFFKEALGLDAAQTTEYLAVVAIPWTIKPLYGLLSDYVPLLGYRRKTWLLLVSMLAAAGFLWMSSLTAPAVVVTALTLTALGVAAADVIIDAIMVESGKRTGQTAEFQSVQWLWMSLGSVVSWVLGGYLCSVLAPGTAMHVAALIALAAPVAVMVGSWMIVREERAAVDLAGMKATTASLIETFKSKTFWAVMAFQAFWYFSPSFGTPWYYHQVNVLNFSQAFIGTLGALSSVGAVLGALAYWHYICEWTLRQQLSFGIVVGTAATLLYLVQLGPWAYVQAAAVAIEILAGAATMIATLATLTQAAQVCADKAEGFTFAALMGATNGIAQIAMIVGARLYTDVFHSMAPLILLSAAFTLACFLLMPMIARAHLEGAAAPRVAT